MKATWWLRDSGSACAEAHTARAMVSDRIYTNSTKAGPTAFSWSGVASEGPLALGATFSDTWSLTLKMTGLQQAYAGATLKPAQLDVSCTALVKPAPPPILFP